MKFTVVDVLPGGRQGQKYTKEYRAAVEAALENEPLWIRLDGLGSPQAATVSGRARGVKKEAVRYLQATGLAGSIDVVTRTEDGRTYPFIRKLPAQR